MSLTGAIDTHVITGKNSREPREIVQAAKNAGMRGLVLKDHQGSTVELAATLGEGFPGIAVLSGLVLNRAVQGWNVEAVEAALKMGAVEIWMPTIGAENDRCFRGFAQGGLRALDEAGKVLPEVIEIIKRVASAGAILGSGHLAPEETAAVVAVARQAGVRAILVTHPEIDCISMPVEFQSQLRGKGLYFERCYCRTGFRRDWSGLAKDIRAVGVESTILATGLGQADLPHPVEGLEEVCRRMQAEGFTPAEIARMTVENPAVALGLE